MCGLAGIWRTDGERESELRQDVGRMAATLVHRGPDDSGSWIDAQVGVAFGFRRLAGVDLSDGGHQPMVSSDGRYVIAFNGEVYNLKELRAGLAQLGFAFRSRSDKEVILNAASAWGVNDAVPRLWGMFAFALWDRQRRLLSLVRDRVGKKPLYYGRCGRTFLFGSELKALRAHPDCVTALDDGAVLSFVRLGYVAAPGSIYRGISSVPPGSIVHVGDDIVPSVHTYWTPTQAERARPLAISDRDAVDELEKLLRDSVTRRLVADVPVGALLSGGVDSSAGVALLPTQASAAVG